MARHESDREDLLREATAYVIRWEMQSPGFSEDLFVGYKRDHSLSIYCGSDPVYHFNSEGQLRRAFVDGRLYRTQGTTLAELTRHRTPDHSELLRRDLDAEQCQRFLQRMRKSLNDLSHSLAAERCQLGRVVGTTSGDAQLKLLESLKRIQNSTTPLSKPFAGRR